MGEVLNWPGQEPDPNKHNFNREGEKEDEKLQPHFFAIENGHLVARLSEVDVNRVKSFDELYTLLRNVGSKADNLEGYNQTIDTIEIVRSNPERYNLEHFRSSNPSLMKKVAELITEEAKLGALRENIKTIDTDQTHAESSRVVEMHPKQKENNRGLFRSLLGWFRK